jgi:hypothetical protein
MKSEGKQELPEGNKLLELNDRTVHVFRNISSSSRSSSSSGSSDIDDSNDSKVVFPSDFLSSLRIVKVEDQDLPVTKAWPLSVRAPVEVAVHNMQPNGLLVQGCKQFWKAGDYEISDRGDAASTCGN